MNKKFGAVFTGIGVLLICSAAALFIYNQLESAKAKKTANDAVSELSIAIENNRRIEESENNQQTPLPQEPTIEIDGHTYIGYLIVPSLDLKLPVMEEWNYEKLKIAPCRQFGTVYEGNMVIAGHNYQSHFGQLGQLHLEDEVIFTDAAGNINNYSVKEIEILLPTDVDAVKNSNWALTLYTCTYGGKERVTIRCDTE